MQLRATPPRTWVSTAIVAMLAIGIGGAIGFGLYKFSPLYVVAGLMGAIIAIITIIKVELGLLTLVLITYIRLSDVLVKTYNAPSIAKPFIGLLLVAIVLQWLFYARPPRNWGNAALLVSGYGLVIFMSLFYAANSTSAFAAINDFWKDGLIAVIVVVLLRNRASLQRVTWALVAVGIFLGGISVYQYITGSFGDNYWGFGQAAVQNLTGSSEGYRIAGPIGDPNFYAQIMLALVPVAFLRAMDEKNTTLRAIALLGTGLTVLTVIFTFSRGAFLSLVIMILVLFYFKPPKPNQLMLMVLVGVVLLRFVPADYTDRLLTLPSLVLGDQQAVRGEVSFRGRSSEMTAAFMMFADHPLFGVGVSNYPTYYQRYSRRIGLDPRTEARQAHNLYLELAAETGLAGILIFSLILWNIFSSVWISHKRLQDAGEGKDADLVLGFGIGIIGYFCAAFFVHGAYPRYLWLLTGIALAIPQVADSILTSGDKDKNV